MATHAYEPIGAHPNDGSQKRRRAARLTTFWVVVAVIGVTPKPIRKALYAGGKSATVYATEVAFNFGHALETHGASRVKGAKVSDTCAACACGEEDLVEVQSSPAPTYAPTTTEYWDLFWTDGAIPKTSAISESYVWTTSNEWEDVHASVLVDTLGYANGLDVDVNGSVVYFTIDGCIDASNRER